MPTTNVVYDSMEFHEPAIQIFEEDEPVRSQLEAFLASPAAPAELPGGTPGPVEKRQALSNLIAAAFEAAAV